MVNAVLASVSSIILEDFLILFDEIVALFEAGDVKGKVIARSLIEAKHFERSSRASLLIEAMNFEAFRLGVMSKNLTESFGVAMEVGDDGFRLGKAGLKFFLSELTIIGADGVI